MKQQRFSYQQLKEEHIKEATSLLTITFLQQNPIWVQSSISPTEAYEIIELRIKRGLAYGRSKVLIDNKTGKIAMALIMLDLYDYINNDFKIPLKFGWQEKFAKNAQELEPDYLKTLNVKKGDYIFADLAGTSKQYANNGISFYFWGYGAQKFKEEGYKYVLFRVTNPLVIRMLRKMGADTVKSAPFVFQDGKSFRSDLMLLYIQHMGDGLSPSL